MPMHAAANPHFFMKRAPWTLCSHALDLPTQTSPTALERRFKMATKEEKTKMISEALDDEERVEKKVDLYLHRCQLSRLSLAS
eukprot:scaffold227229_cov23-Tisochrysis_lutea.AAC.5